MAAEPPLKIPGGGSKGGELTLCPLQIPLSALLGPGSKLFSASWSGTDITIKIREIKVQVHIFKTIGQRKIIETFLSLYVSYNVHIHSYRGKKQGPLK
jgi:hypothetical protein